MSGGDASGFPGHTGVGAIARGQVQNLVEGGTSSEESAGPEKIGSAAVKWSRTIWLTDSGGDGKTTHIIMQFFASRVHTLSGVAAVRWSRCWAGFFDAWPVRDYADRNEKRMVFGTSFTSALGGLLA